ncbi:hypothetical protein DITRI_Ditri14bG0140800 [Diplodiscus trichospermus]
MGMAEGGCWYRREEPKKFTAPATYMSQSLQTNTGGAVENCGSSHVVRVLPSDRPIHATVTSGGVPVSSPPAHVKAAGLASLQHQLPTRDVKTPTSSIGLPSGHLGRDSSSFAYPRVERPQIKKDGGSNVAYYGFQVPAYSSASHPLMNAPTWSIHAQPAALAKSGQEKKVLTHNPTKVEGSTGLTVPHMAPQAVRDQTFRPFIAQTAAGTFPSVHQPIQGMNFAQTPPFINNHDEIAQIVQKLLKQKFPEDRTWTPPSREYMNKALTCQTCKLTINEVETVLLCDACEKGFHLKCLQSNNQKGIPRGEWHCARCLSFYNGKPLPPKYGRVMRNINIPKAPSSTTEPQSSSEKKVENLDPMVNHEKVTTNGSPALQTPAVVSAVDSNSAEPAYGSKIPEGTSKNLWRLLAILLLLPHTEISRHPEFSSDGLHAVECTGDVLQVAGGKKFYQSCHIDDITYKVQDHALVHSGQGKLIPSKLQAMWEDAKTGWLSFLVVCWRLLLIHVYESNNDTTVTASSIQGQCEVLPATKFKEESERRNDFMMNSKEAFSLYQVNIVMHLFTKHAITFFAVANYIFFSIR